jgi:hypothetical protein
MADIGRLLETMHPMREPPPPDAITPYLLVLAVGCVAGVALFLVTWRLRHRRAALRTAADAALEAARGLAPADRIAAQARLLRRVVRSVGGEAAASTYGDAWLQRLDDVFATNFFTAGAGIVFGDALYRRPGDIDLDGLDRSIRGLIANVRPARARA